MTSLPERAARRCHHMVNPIHSAVYFSPALGKELAPYGIEDPAAVYLAGRAAPLGAVGAGAVTATFYNFSHSLVARVLPDVWESASPSTVLAARLRAVDSMLRELLGEEAAASPQMAEAAQLALKATEACTRPGRPLYAANADLPVPDAPHLAYWHAATLLREHRGDAHIAVLLQAGLDPLEALASHTASGRGMAPKWVLATRGYNHRDWAAAQDRLRERGLMDAEGDLTDEGATLRKELEHSTDRLDSAPYEHLGEAGVERLTELASEFAATAATAGAFPADLFGRD
ncbi:SCO6745 family protein [Streptomyces albidus (ex Kaewkla and Franco 2022)]|uniref:SCO6745 family protein n=1 Tax=Streptomyces albidus (ex Kaewkla and Franco 2022) TaxID=722709 RepID=UPI0015EFB057|nr:hypothetical protein [Streptomyces albidus (ex Kaewkla and Franco 2022)]